MSDKPAGNNRGFFWPPFVAQDEALLWVGAPSPAFRLSPWLARLGVVGLGFGILSAFANLAGETGSLTTLFGGLSALSLVFCVLWGANEHLKRGMRSYALTDRRAVSVSTSRKGQMVDWADLPGETQVSRDGRATSSAYFRKQGREAYRPQGFWGRTPGATGWVAFERIAHDDPLWALLRERGLLEGETP